MTRCALLGVLALVQGCYTYTPLDTGVPPVGEAVALEISDRGRVDLSERLGRGVGRIEGRLTGLTDDQLLINVAAVSYISGERSRWSGESMRLSRTYVDGSAVRRLSKRRTWTLVAVVAAATVGLVVTQDLLVNFFGNVDDDGGTTEPPISFTPILRFP